MTNEQKIADLERTAAVHEATRAEIQRGPWTRRKEAQLRDLQRLAWACRREAEALRRKTGWSEAA